MDYKSRFPILPHWPRAAFRALRSVVPFVYPGFGEILEMNSPDGSATFLCIGLSIGLEDESFVEYFIEASSECDMRIAFENGLLSFEDFAGHRGWLIRAAGKILSEEPRQMS